MFKRIGLLLVAGIMMTASRSSAQEYYLEQPTMCEPGFTYVEDVIHRQVCKKICRVVPEVKKIRVPIYDMAWEEVCKLKCGPGDCIPKDDKCDCSPHNEYSAPPAGCEKYRKVRKLVKRMVEVEHHIFKCEMETIVDMVPCRIYRKVPCPVATANKPAQLPPVKESQELPTREKPQVPSLVEKPKVVPVVHKPTVLPPADRPTPAANQVARPTPTTTPVARPSLLATQVARPTPTTTPVAAPPSATSSVAQPAPTTPPVVRPKPTPRPIH